MRVALGGEGGIAGQAGGRDALLRLLWWWRSRSGDRHCRWISGRQRDVRADCGRHGAEDESGLCDVGTAEGLVVQLLVAGVVAAAQDLGQGLRVAGLGGASASRGRWGDDAVHMGASEGEWLVAEQLPDLRIGDQVNVDRGGARAALLQRLDEPGPWQGGVADGLGCGAGQREVDLPLSAVELELADEHDGQRALGGGGTPDAGQHGLRVGGIGQFDERGGGSGARPRGRPHRRQRGNHPARVHERTLACRGGRQQQRGSRSSLCPVDLHIRTLSAASDTMRPLQGQVSTRGASEPGAPRLPHVVCTSSSFAPGARANCPCTPTPTSRRR